jgi:hypothetical protein
MVVLALATFASLGSSRLDRPGPPPLPNVSFFQLDVELDGDKHKHSEWGAVDLEFVGSSSLLYFNLTVQSGDSGSPVWRIQNLPVLSREGPDTAQQTTFNFNLANKPGKKVPSLDYAFALTASPLSDMPLPLVHAKVEHRKYEIDAGFGDPPILFAPPPEFLAAGAPDGDKCVHKNFPNQEVDKDECVPGAVSNSLMWLNDTYDLGISGEDISVAALKGGTGWDANRQPRPGCDDNWPGLKKQYLLDHDIPVTTTEEDAFRMNKVQDAVCAGCDVEIGIGQHCVAVTGIQKLANGDYSLDVTHDATQDHTGNTITETVTYDNTLGQFHGAPWCENKVTEFIVVECPVTKTPTPSTTPSPTPTPTPSGTPTPGVTQTSAPTATFTPTTLTPTRVPSTPTPGS